MFEDQLCSAIEKGEIMDIYADELKRLSIQNDDDEYNALQLFQRYVLYTRIHKGAEYIEQIGKDHQNYVKAMQKYDKLCAEVERLNNVFDIAV